MREGERREGGRSKTTEKEKGVLNASEREGDGRERGRNKAVRKKKGVLNAIERVGKREKEVRGIIKPWGKEKERAKFC